MAKRKRKKLISLRFDPLVVEVLHEASLGSGDILLGGDQELAKQMNRSDWIYAALASMMSTALRKVISTKQVDRYTGTDEIFRLFIMYSRARRGVPDYGFTNEDEETRFIYGPLKIKE